LVHFKKKAEPDERLPRRCLTQGGDTEMAKEKPLKPDDFPIEADDKKLKTNKGKSIASTESEAIADDLAERVNEQADREEHDRWSA
jgi:hypothetical protein